MGHMSVAHAKRVSPGPANSQARRRYVRHRPEDTVLYEVIERGQGTRYAGSAVFETDRLSANADTLRALAESHHPIRRRMYQI
ncbi:MAG: hypothetical protein ACI9W2_003237 [Gammaproteobacteria bacterium]|jgi:hypothetical protein